jgi:hypothetical protein
MSKVKVTIYQVTRRPWGELVTRAGPDRPVCVGSGSKPSIRRNGSHFRKGRGPVREIQQS